MKRLFILFSLFLFILSCGIFGKKEDYFPMGVGSIWNYEAYLITQAANSLDTIAKTKTRFEAKQKTKLNDGTEVTEFLLLDTTWAREPRETIYVYADTQYIRKHNNYVLLHEDKRDAQPDTILALPLEKGKTWRVNPNTMARVMDKENVVVLAGVFKNSWKIEETVTYPQPHKRYHFFASGTGRVKCSTSVLKRIFYQELASATIK